MFFSLIACCLNHNAIESSNAILMITLVTSYIIGVGILFSVAANFSLSNKILKDAIGIDNYCLYIGENSGGVNSKTVGTLLAGSFVLLGSDLVLHAYKSVPLPELVKQIDVLAEATTKHTGAKMSPEQFSRLSNKVLDFNGQPLAHRVVKQGANLFSYWISRGQ